MHAVYLCFFMFGIIKVKLILYMELFTDIIRLLPHFLSYFSSLSSPINLLNRISHHFISHLCQGRRALLAPSPG